MSLASKLIAAFQEIAADIKTLSNNVGNKIITTTFNTPDVIPHWRIHDGNAERNIVGGVLRVGNNSGNEQLWISHLDMFPIRWGEVYRISAKVRKSTGNGKLYLGVNGVLADKNTLCNASGANSYSGQHYAVPDYNVGTAWEVIEGHIASHNTSLTGYTNPKSLHQNVVYITPMALVNFHNQVGITEIEWIKLEVVQSASAPVTGGSSGTAQLSAQQLKDFEQMRRYAGVSHALASVPLSVTKSPHTPTSKTVSLVAEITSWHATATPATQLILEWGDGQTETVAITAPQATHTHTYTAVGNYTVTVKTDDPYHGVGSPQTVAYTVVPDIVPTATISVGLISSTATATVGATTSYAGQPYTVEIDWGIGAGWTSTTSHNYAATGTYTVQARVITTGGTSAIVTENVTIAATSSAPTTWTITQSGVYSGTTAATQANMHTNSGTYPAGCYTNAGSPAHMTAMFPATAYVTTVKLKACNEPAQNEGWDESYLNGATLQYTTDGTTWTNVATVSGHTSGETAFKDYPVNQNCLGVRVQVSGYLAIGQFTIV